MGGKMLIVSFEEDEEEIFDTVLKVLQENEMIQFQHKCRNKNEIRYINLLIDIGQRIVKKCNQETELTYKEFEILHLLARIQVRYSAKNRFMILSGTNRTLAITTL